MERKIGEIFEYNDEWYQCVEGKSCKRCDFYQPNFSASQCDKSSYCLAYKRKDKTSVIFKKLEKLGDPFERNGYMYQEYKAHIFPLLMNGDAKIPTRNGFAVIIKQNKEEDMKTVKVSKDDLNFLVNKIRYGILPKHTDWDKITSEITDLFSVKDINLSNAENIGKNLKPFDLEAAKSGKPVCTRDGRKARIICFDQKDIAPIVGLVTGLDGKESIYAFYKDGRVSSQEERVDDLMMLTEKKEGWINIYNADTTFYYVDGRVFETKDEAVKEAKKEVEQEQREKNEYIGTIRVEWEE